MNLINNNLSFGLLFFRISPLSHPRSTLSTPSAEKAATCEKIPAPRGVIELCFVGAGFHARPQIYGYRAREGAETLPYGIKFNFLQKTLHRAV